METKQKRTKVKVILSIILPVLLITGILAVSGHAKKPLSPPGQSKPEPVLVSITGSITGVGTDGDIDGTGNPATMAIHFSGNFTGFDKDGIPYEEIGTRVQNPDRENPLRIGGTPKNKNFSYRYCDHHSHVDSIDICNMDDETNPDSHSPYYYKELDIYGGILDKKTGKIFWPAGSDWRISWKEIMGTIITGTLDVGVTYEVLQWSN